mgnify:CR=1 FL=1
MKTETGVRGSRGFSLSEMLVVVAIVGLAVAIAIPVTSEQVRLAKVRAAADEFAIHLKAARMIAVTTRATADDPLEFVVVPDPTNTYRYPAVNGQDRTYRLPSGVRIVSPTAETTIAFRGDGSLAAANTTVLEAMISGDERERFTVTTSILGVSTVSRARVRS